MSNSNQGRILVQSRKTFIAGISTILICIIMSLLIYWKFIFGDAYYIGTTDMLYQCYPYMVHLSRCISNLKFPTWTFLIGIGDVFPLRYIGNILNVILCSFGEETLPYLLIYDHMLKIALSAIFFFLFLKRIKMTDLGAMIGAVAYSFSSIMIIRGLWFAYSTEVLLLALLLWTLEIYFQDDKRILLFISLTLLFTYKGMYYIVLYCAICFIYATARYYICEGAIFTKGYLRYLSNGLLSIILAGGVSCVINLPLLIQTLNSGRIDTTFGATRIPLFAGIDRIGTALLKCFSSVLMNNAGGDIYIPNGLDGPLFYFGTLISFLFPLGYYIKNKRIKKLYFILTAFGIIYTVCPYVSYVCNLGISSTYFKLSTLWFCTAGVIASIYIFDHVILEKQFKKTYLFIVTLLIEGVIGYLCFINSMFSDNIIPSHVFVLMVLIFFYMMMLWIYYQKGYWFVPYILLMILCVELGGSARLTSDSAYYVAEIAGYKKGSDMKTDAALTDVATIASNCDRVVWKDKYPSLGLLYGINGTGYLEDIGESYVEFVQNVVGEKTENIVHSFTNGYRNREHWLLDILLGVKYRIVYPEDVLLTDIYTIVKSYDDGRMLVENTEAFPLGVMYDNYISYEQIELLNNEDIQYTLLNALVCDGVSEGEILTYPRKKVNIEGISCDVEDSISYDEVEEITLCISDNVTTVFVPVEGIEEKTYTISFDIISEKYDSNICDVVWYDGKQWNYLGRARDKEVYKFLYTDSTNNRFKISGSDIQMVALQFQNGEDDVIIRNLEIYEYDEENLESNLKNMVEERKEQGVLEIEEFEDTRIKGTVDCKKTGKMLLTIPYNLGWKAYVDGKQVDINKVDYGLMSIDITEGHHEVILYYELPGLKVGILGSMISLIMIIVVCRRDVQKRKSKNVEIDEK